MVLPDHSGLDVAGFLPSTGMFSVEARAITLTWALERRLRA